MALRKESQAQPRRVVVAQARTGEEVPLFWVHGTFPGRRKGRWQRLVGNREQLVAPSHTQLFSWKMLEARIAMLLAEVAVGNK